MAVPVEGRTGFSGANFVFDWFVGSGEPVVNFDKLTNGGNLETLASLCGDAYRIFVQGDIGSSTWELLAQCKIGPLIVFAVGKHVGCSMHHSGDFFETNIVGSCKVFELVKGYWNGRFENEKSRSGADMDVTPAPILGGGLIEPRVFGDERGLFFENCSRNVFVQMGGYALGFVQGKHSKSIHGVLWGPYDQLPPTAQRGGGDLAVDIRKGLQTFGRWAGEILSAGSKKQLLIPPGFAYGFVTLSEVAEFLNKTTDHYATEFERCIAWLAGLGSQLSAQDLTNLSLAQAEVCP